MTEQEGRTILPPDQEGEEKMAEITCVGCGRSHVINYSTIVVGGTPFPGVIEGVITCHAPLEGQMRPPSPCHAKTVFSITGNSVSFLPGRLFEEELASNVSPEVRGLFEDALRSFYGKGYKGTLALCRSAVEQSLDEKHVAGRDLYNKVRDCPESILGAQEKTWAEAARINGREALHHLMMVTTSHALTGLTMTITLVNHIASKSPLPASQSGPGSNVP